MELSFGAAVWLLPLATTMHVWEEWPGFPHWARVHASPAYSDAEYVRTHILAVGLAFANAALLWFFPRPWLVLLLFMLAIGPAFFCNALFHAGASIVSRRYCPGAVTGLLIYLPLCSLLVWLALREGLMTSAGLLAVAVVAPAFHAAEVGHNVFKRW